MASLVATILIRTVRRDLAKYEQLMVDGNVDMKEEAGWKLLTGDVFRAPGNPKGLCVYVGTGTQVGGRGGGAGARAAGGRRGEGGRLCVAGFRLGAACARFPLLPPPPGAQPANPCCAPRAPRCCAWAL